MKIAGNGQTEVPLDIVSKRKKLMRTEERIVDMPATEQASIHGHAWVVLSVAYIAGIICTINLMKVPPLIPILMDHFKVNLANAGLMMSVISFVGLLLRIPSGVLVQKVGIRMTGILAMLFSVLGGVLGAVATNYPVFLVSRGLEGVGLGLTGLVGSTTAGIWFPPHKVGLVMGIVNTNMGVGGFLGMLLIPRMAHSIGWQGVWWVSAALSGVALLLVAALVRTPPWMSASAVAAGTHKPPSLKTAFANRNIWLWALMYLCILLPSAMISYYITYLNKVQGFSLEKAGLVSSLGSVGSLIGALLGGYLIGKIGHLKASLTISLVIFSFLLLLAFNISGMAIPIWMVVVGVLGMGYMPVLCLTAVPRIVGGPQLTGIGMAIAGFGGAVGGIVGPPLFGFIVDKAGWNMGAYLLVPFLVLAILFINVTKIPEP